MVVFEKKIRKLRKNVDLKTKLLIIGEKIKNNKSLGRFSLVESVLMGWIKIQQSLYIPLSGAIVREKLYSSTS